MVVAVTDTSLPVCVAALYRFTPFENFAELRGPLQAACDANGVQGTLLLAREGINGTIAGTDAGIAAVLEHIRALPGCAEIEVKFSRAPSMPFLRMKVRLKKEIVTMGVPGLDPRSDVGHYVPAEEWNALLEDPDTILIDTRNDYEVAAGTFKGAIDPKTKTFREFPDWFRTHRAELIAEGRTPRIAMFCTGGIRCEKATAFVKAEGLDEVYHLQGGILKYLENIPEENSLWRGECFVFDQRVTVKHGLEPGSLDQCHACRMPLTAEEMASPEYEHGVSCPHCYNERDEKQRARYAERERQAQLAAERGEAHLGAHMDEIRERKRREREEEIRRQNEKRQHAAQ
ncbi:rhodanese-like protein [Acetobacter cerevisiae]|uniref:tRNA uridine(34) hydroxylase n=1 Tax=Acetobacter cerevisiae TaxID=178900 RepID=A0A149VDL4_9PROT|nr:rhodanese-related sulfurtransferase [Acetobacter cerevisiae]KXV78234.1 rhodanese-like protein [Acetobacter cerevisiae]